MSTMISKSHSMLWQVFLILSDDKSLKRKTVKRQITRKDTGSCLMGASTGTKGLNTEWNEKASRSFSMC